MDPEVAGESESEETCVVFKRKIESMIASGTVAFSLSIGINLGLFQTLAGLKAPASPGYIAKQAGCNDRFLREWLFHMVVAGIVETAKNGTRYYLPQHRATVLLSQGAADLTTFLPSTGTLFNSLLHSFKTGNTTGAIFRLPQTDFFRRWEERKEQACHKLIDVLIKHVPDLQDGLERGINVLDVGCGRGHFLFAMAAEYPGSLFTGIDINDGLIGDARDQARDRMLHDVSLTNIGFAAYDAAILPRQWRRRFDVVMMHEVVYDLPSPADVLQEVKQVLTPGGVLVVVDRSLYGDPRRNLGEHAQRITALIAPIVSMNYSLPVAMSQPEGDSDALGLCSGKETLIQVIRDAHFDDIQTFDFTIDEQKVEILIIARQSEDATLLGK